MDRKTLSTALQCRLRSWQTNSRMYVNRMQHLRLNSSRSGGLRQLPYLRSHPIYPIYEN
ncbi:unnamed protein product [Nesidiocoris tenuis]|uniref:Uncharacterized protein n=1 Tax=Nesidiocoris tenuis TaxID=355587 RepID=A0A6H5G971_9HEMI|nr:unnamed protein product [Nesidiocoris tenuis]